MNNEQNNTTAPEETAANLLYEKYQRYRNIADAVVKLLRQYEIRYDEIAKLQTYIKAKIWKEALYS